MAPFQLRVRTLNPRTQPVPFAPLSIGGLGPPPTSDVHAGEVRTQHVGSTRRPLSPELRTTTPPHGTPWAQLRRVHTPPGRSASPPARRASSSSYSDTASCPAGHTAALLAVTSMSKSAAVSLTSPIILIGLPWRPAPDRAHQLRPPTLCLPSVVSGTIRSVRTTAPKDRSHALSTCLSPQPSHRRRCRSTASPPRG